MKAAYIKGTGSPSRIVYGDLPKPKPAGKQVLVKVEAVSVNPIDTYLRSGAVAMELPKPYIIGCDLAGEVVAVGPEATRFQKGDRVWGSNQGLLGRQGTFAQFAAVDEDWLYPIPPDVSAEAAAAIALVGITAHLGLFRCAELRDAERVFVSGGSGGVGSCVVQMAKATGAQVVTTASTSVKADVCRQLGADHVLGLRQRKFAAALAELGPFDVWFETSRHIDFDRVVPMMALGGRIVVMAGREARPRFPLGPFYVHDLKLFGFAMFNAPPEEQRKCAADINRWLVRGRLKPLIDRVLPLSKAAEAHRLQEKNTLKKPGLLCGKIVLKP